MDNLTVSYGGWTLFDEISFLINEKDRIGLVGKNGAGKTTLLRIITGEQQPTEGAVTINGECTIGYLPQQMRVADTTTLKAETEKAFDEVLRLEAEIASLTAEIAERTDYESEDYASLLHRLNDAQDHYHILGGDTREADIEKTLLGLGFKREDFGRATSEFSGGWRMRIELAKLLLRRPSIFLLDEPTNHLDIESIQWLEEYLRTYNGAVLLISHDRAFLDNVTTRTIELSLGHIYDYKVPYSKFVELSAERRALLAAYGAEIVLTEGARGMTAAIEKAQELAREIEGSFIPSQFENAANPMAHYNTTGPEIWEDAEGRVDAFVAGVGTGGTLSGVGRYLKEQNPNCRIVAVEPASSPLLSKGYAGAHGLQGIGANFVPKNLDQRIIDDIVAVTEEDAYKAARAFATTEGLLVGITSGAALHAAVELSKQMPNGARIAVLLPDTGERYLSTPLFKK